MKELTNKEKQLLFGLISRQIRSLEKEDFHNDADNFNETIEMYYEIVHKLKLQKDHI